MSGMQQLRIGLVAPLAAFALCGSWAPLLGAQQAEQALIKSEPLEPNAQASFGNIAYHIMLAELAGRRGEMAAALENYQIAADLSDDPRVAERATGMALYVKNDELTLKLAERWYQLEPDSPRVRQALALGLLRNGQIEAAMPHLEAAREDAVDDQQGFVTLTALLDQVGDPEVSYQVLAVLRERHSESHFAHYYFALAAARSDRDDEALQGLAKALELQPDWREALLLSTQIRLQRADTTTDNTSDDVDVALAELGAAVERNPEDRQMRIGYARLLVSVDKLTEARVQFEQLAEQNPDDADSLYALGVLAADAEQFDDAQDYLQRVLELGQRSEDAYFELGRINERQQKFAEAQRWYEKVPPGERFISAQLRASAVQTERGEMDQALARLAALRKEYPDRAVSLFVAEADLLRGQSLFQQAFELLDSALQQSPNDHELLYARALAAERIDRLDVLERDLRIIIDAEPDNGHALNALGYTLADRTDRYQEALGYLERAIKLLPNDAAVLDSMGWVKYRLGDIDSSISFLRRAFEINDDAEIVSHLSEVLLAAGQHEEAKKLWQKALREAPDSKHLLRLKDRFVSDD